MKRSRRNILLFTMLFFASVALLAFNISDTPKPDKLRNIQFTFNVTTSPDVTLPEGFADTLKKAEMILSKIFSSQEFRDTLYKLDFNALSFSKTKNPCFEVVLDKDGRASGKGVYENLTNTRNVKLEWMIKRHPKGSKAGVMGSAAICGSKITSYDQWIKNNQYLSLRFVRHWAHEYTHISGYHHGTRLPEEDKWGRKKTEDPAFAVGGIVAHIMLDWTKRGLL